MGIASFAVSCWSIVFPWLFLLLKGGYLVYGQSLTIGVFGAFCGIAGIVLGGIGKKKMKGGGLTIAGLILGIIGVITSICFGCL